MDFDLQRLERLEKHGCQSCDNKDGQEAVWSNGEAVGEPCSFLPPGGSLTGSECGEPLGEVL